MSHRGRISLLAVVAAMLILVAVAAHAQRLSPFQPGVTPQTPTVLSGGDFGFRIEGMKGDAPVGVLVVRQNGQSRWS